MTVLFGYGSLQGVSEVPEILRVAAQADRDGLDLVSVSDHPYLADRLEAYAQLGFMLGRTERISALVTVSNLPLRPAPMLARTATSLMVLTGGRFVLGLGAGGAWDQITTMGVPRLSPGQAVDAFEEAMRLVRRMAGGAAVHTGESTAGRPRLAAPRFTAAPAGTYYPVELVPAPVAAPPIWTGSVGPKSLAATGRQADGWIPGHAADWLSERYKWSRPVIDEAAQEAGRRPSDISTVFNLPGMITTRALARTRDEDGRWVGGSAQQWIDELTSAVLEHDAAGFMLFPAGPDPFATTVARWANEIAPAVRAAAETASRVV